MGLRLLHLSDIHFKQFDGKDYLDQDIGIRNELERDIKNLTDKNGPINVILIGGDIAFSGQESEYQNADKWIKKVCDIVKCPYEYVLTVPGNHDIDRSKICNVVKTIQASFKGFKKRTEIDAHLEGFLTSNESSAILLKPLINYMNFAQKFGVVPEAEDNPLFWQKDFALDGETLRIRGINSAVVSNKFDDEDTSKLILGSLQTLLLRENGVIYIVMCHHPPEWIIDGEDAERDLTAISKLNLYGHKHSIKFTRVNDSLKLAAGAMQPPREEIDWSPRYNVIEIGLEKESNSSQIKFKIWKRMWDPQNSRFKPDFNDNGNEIHEYSFNHEKVVSASVKKNKKNTTPEIMTENVELINPSTPDPYRKLAYYFLSLPYHKKIEIANALVLIDDTDINLPEIKKLSAYLQRAKERDLLYQLWEMVMAAQPERIEIINPYKSKSL